MACRTQVWGWGIFVGDMHAGQCLTLQGVLHAEHDRAVAKAKRTAAESEEYLRSRGGAAPLVLALGFLSATASALSPLVLVRPPCNPLICSLPYIAGAFVVLCTVQFCLAVVSTVCWVHQGFYCLSKQMNAEGLLCGGRHSLLANCHIREALTWS